MMLDKLLLQSTKIIIQFLDKLFASNIKVNGIENLTVDNPILFVCNHFTRSETFILPYIIEKYTGSYVRSLADDAVFVGILGKYLKKLGVLSTENPDRNDIIIGDIMTKRHNWLIYPEGIMVKNKAVSHIGKLYCIKLDDMPRPIFTGSSVLAMQSELLKQRYFFEKEHDNKEFCNKFKQKYNIRNERQISIHQTAIIPVTLNFYPIRPDHNKLESAIRLLFKQIPDRLAEEILVESSILLKIPDQNFLLRANLYI